MMTGKHGELGTDRLRADEGGLVLVLAVIVVVGILVLAVMVTWGVSGGGPFAALGGVEEDEVAIVPTVTMNIKASSLGTIYDVDLEMNVDHPSFLHYFFSASIDPGFPAGDDELRLVIYEGTLTTKKDQILVNEAWKVGNMYNVNDDGMQDSVWEVDLPKLITDKHPDGGVVHLWAFVYFNDAQVGQKHWAVNPELMEVKEL